MLNEWSLFGFLLPPLLVPLLLAGVLHFLSRRLWSRIGLYRWFWHPSLVDMAFLALWLWVVMALWPTPV